MNAPIKLIECPRDAMQGIKKFIPTQLKIDYINTLMQVGFDTIDFGSFVSPNKIPQLADTEEVLAGIVRGISATKLLSIVVNEKGAKKACSLKEIDCIGYPFSISETFQLRNTNKTIPESIDFVRNLVQLCQQNNKELIVYISMCFGNPYGDPFDEQIIIYWIEALVKLGVKTISLSDTVGVADISSINSIFKLILGKFLDVEIGAHFHSRFETSTEKIEAAYQSGCRRFDGAIKGYGGCPMAKDELVGNIPTELLIDFFSKKNLPINIELFNESFRFSDQIFM